MAVVAIIVVIADQLSKVWMLNHLTPGEPLPVIGNWFRFYLLFNSGAAFSMGSSITPVFTTIQLLFVLGVIVMARRIPTPMLAFAFALIAGGTAGNLYDRLFRAPGFFVGHVVDFISVGSFAVFNVADSAITVGVGVIILSMFADSSHSQTSPVDAGKTQVAEAKSSAKEDK